MLLNENWDFETAVREISQKYYAGGITTGPLRNRQIESWGQLVGKTRATGEFNAAIELHGSLSAFGRAYRVSLPILQGFKKFFENLPDDQIKDTVFAGNTLLFLAVFFSQSVPIKLPSPLAALLSIFSIRESEVFHLENRRKKPNTRTLCRKTCTQPLCYNR